MKINWRIFGKEKVSTTPVQTEQRDATPEPKKPRKRVSFHGRAIPAKRSFNAGIVDRLSSDFVGMNLSTNTELRAALPTMRYRARNLSRNEPYTKAFIESAVRNIVGHDGLRFKCMAINPDGSLDERANKIVETGLYRWGKRKNCTVTKRKSWTGAQKMICRMLVRDGEVFVRKVRGFDNEFGFALQIIAADYVDHTYEAVLSNGNRVIMGVEINKWGEPVAYYVLKYHPGDYSPLPAINGDKYERVLAKEMCHVYITEDSEQLRGIPWIYVAITRLNQLGAYEEAEVIAARIQACQNVYYTSKTDEPYEGDDEDEDGNILEDMSPGQRVKLPAGLDVKFSTPTHPNPNLAPFEKAMLRGICAGIGGNYNLIAQDLEGVNFSSIRAGTLDERDGWKILQHFFVEEFADDVYESWLEVALLTEFLKPLPYSKLEKFNEPYFRGRRWPWVDPEKDMRANAFAVLMGWKTNTEVCEDMDGDFSENMERLKVEMAKMKKAGFKQAVPQMLSFINEEPEPEPGDTTGEGEDSDPLKELTKMMNAYGVGVRSGAITPNQDDENFFRTKAGLPVAPAPVKAAWEKDGEVRRPITLQSQKAFAGAQADIAGEPKPDAPVPAEE